MVEEGGIARGGGEAVLLSDDGSVGSIWTYCAV